MAQGINESYRLPPAAPFHNEGKTLAGWTLFYGVAIGLIIAAVGLFTSPVLLWIGLGVAVLSCVASFVLRAMGKGQPRTTKPGDWYGA